MGVTTKTVMKIECDNPNCPGNDLDPKSYEGWIRVQVATQFAPPPIASAKPGETETPAFYIPPISTPEQVFCSSTCAGSIQIKIEEINAQREAAVEAAREALTARDQIDASLPTPA
jgi:hypothetical protein